jgi:hypothetical protein
MSGNWRLLRDNSVYRPATLRLLVTRRGVAPAHPAAGC